MYYTVTLKWPWTVIQNSALCIKLFVVAIITLSLISLHSVEFISTSIGNSRACCKNINISHVIIFKENETFSTHRGSLEISHPHDAKTNQGQFYFMFFFKQISADRTMIQNLPVIVVIFEHPVHTHILQRDISIGCGEPVTQFCETRRRHKERASSHRWITWIPGAWPITPPGDWLFLRANWKGNPCKRLHGLCQRQMLE